MSEKRRIVGRTVGTPLSLDKIKEINLREFPDDELHRTVSEDEKAEWNKKVKSVNGKEANELGAVSLSATDVGAEQIGQTARVVGMHNANTSAHNDIRLLIAELGNRLNAVANSEDVNLDQLSEIVAYIKSNKSLIDTITTNKVNYSDIINNLTTNVSNKPLSAAQGVELKALLDALTALVGTLPEETNATSLAEYIYLIALDCRDFDTNQYEQIKNLQDKKLDKIELTNAVNNALAQAKSSGEFDGVGVLGVHQTVTSTADGGTNVMTMGLTDGNSYTFTVKNGKKGSAGKSAYQYAQDGGYTGTEEEFAAKMASENTGSGSVQSDLTQNDETAPDYVKGRTHYTKETVIIPETTPTMDEESGLLMVMSDYMFGNKTYIVYWNGVRYETKGGSVGEGEEAMGYCGNVSAMDETFPNTGEPFLIMSQYGAIAMMSLTGETSVTVKICEAEVVKLPAKYLPYYLITLKPEEYVSNSTLIYINRDAIELAEMIKNNVPIYVDLTSMLGYELRVLVTTYKVGGMSLDQMIAMLGSAGTMQLYAPEFGINEAQTKYWSFFVNSTD